MNPKPNPDGEFRISANEFDRMMRGALSAPEPKKPTREPKKVDKVKPKPGRK